MAEERVVSTRIAASGPEESWYGITFDVTGEPGKLLRVVIPEGTAFQLADDIRKHFRKPPAGG
jgi:hypothetical protein